MFITFYTQKQINQKHLNELFFNLLDDPTNTQINYQPPSTDWFKITKNIKNEYAENYYLNHTPKPIKEIIPPFNITEIKEHYYSFRIPKKTDPNKYRQIDAPDIPLKNYQTYIKSILEWHLKVLPHSAAHAYVKNNSTLTALKNHQNNNSKWFLKLDLKDFFPSHNKEYVIKMLKEIYPFGTMFESEFKKIEHMLDYAFLNDQLPQGTPLSPMLTNLCMVPIDFMITERLKNFKKKSFIYTRYADDLLISCKYKFNPKDVITAINKIFKHYQTPFRINKEKTRFGSSSGRNWNLGIMLNKDNNITIGHKKKQQFRAMLYDFINNYNQWPIEKVQKTLGLIAYYKMIEPDYINYQINKYSKKYNIPIIEKMKLIIANN